MKSIYPEHPRLDQVEKYVKTRFLWMKNFVYGDVLDAPSGCGWGASLYNNPRMKSVTCIDLDNEALNYGRRHYPFSFLRGNVLNINYRNKFDTAISAEAIEHLTICEDIVYIKNLFRALKEGGLFLGSTPNCALPDNKRREKEKGTEIQGHINLFSGLELLRLLSIFEKIDIDDITSPNCFLWKCYKPKTSPISIVILSYNRIKKTIKLIRSIKQYTRLPYHIFIFDNGSGDYTKTHLDAIKRLDDSISICYYPKNLGCGLGRGKALDYVESEYVVFLDNDMEVTEGWIEKLLSTIEKDPKIAGVCSQVRIGNQVQLNGRKMVNNKICMKSQLEGKGECDIIPGGASIFRTEALRKVKFDPVLTNNFDDLDISLQLKKLGYKLYNCPEAILQHSPDFKEYRKEREMERKKAKEHFEKKWGIKIEI